MSEPTTSPASPELPDAADLPVSRPTLAQRAQLERARARCTLVFSLTLCAVLLLGPLMHHGALYAVLSTALLVFACITLWYRAELRRRFRRNAASS